MKGALVLVGAVVILVAVIATRSASQSCVAPAVGSGHTRQYAEGFDISTGETARDCHVGYSGSMLAGCLSAVAGWEAYGWCVSDLSRASARKNA